MIATYQLVCSPNGKETKNSNHRDTFHVFAGLGVTFCGRDSAGWHEITRKTKSEIFDSTDCCKRCATALRNRDGGSQ